MVGGVCVVLGVGYLWGGECLLMSFLSFLPLFQQITNDSYELGCIL